MSADYGHGNETLALDGNAAAGMLGELFAFDVTTAIVTCDGCGTAEAAAVARVYGGTMGAIFRCVHCDAVVIRLTHTPKGYFLDMQGARRVFWRPNAP
jgi:hypothetical protein